MENKRTPEIRFAGFTDTWEHRRLGEIAADTYGGGTPATSNEEYWNGNIPWIQSSDLTENHLFGVAPKKHISESGLRKSATKLIPQNSIAIVTRVGVGKLAIMPTQYTTSQDFLSLSNLKADVWYSVYAIYKKLRGELNAVQGTSIKGITKEELLSKSIFVPQIEEQAKIGKLFKQLDDTIDLHQHELTTLKQTKQGFLQEMFPAEGASVPKIRFPGFTGDWEERKLGEVIDNQYNGQTPSRENTSFWEGDINWLSSGELNRGVVAKTIEKITEDGRKSANLKIVPKGTFVMAITGLEAAGTRGNCAKLGIDTTLNQSCMALYPNEKLLNSSFLFQWYRKVGQEYGLQYTQGTKQQSYNAELIKKLPIILPSVSEQILIADFFDSLDNLITLHQRELDALKETKKAFLQKMFV
ncbi:restriction endonuclease subunit S [Paenibacillus xylanilyticus]|uniref:Restriction endonuclease subunit S n=1 Tax=Paenibacillus xylanilyticus TaxID=248903 RepID=A0A7Y6BVH3_9BACL|nr:restriction endonuclease subunit S [Paenibacillus xylanilyticus]NUU75333.1 restriction endonuclease subunit S [Paenibacillus xylanilyticus]